MILLTLYLLYILHQTTTQQIKLTHKLSCISYISYIKPQRKADLQKFFKVVSLIYPTSNHNLSLSSSANKEVYLLYILHQTTTETRPEISPKSCISYISYIKPQLRNGGNVRITVVSLIYPTSNHNVQKKAVPLHQLYLLYILHQTTTLWIYRCQLTGCISYISYIKPQLLQRSIALPRVVSLIYPTSNHNQAGMLLPIYTLYLLYILHQTTTQKIYQDYYRKLYLLYILHQTTTHKMTDTRKRRLYLLYILHQTTTGRAFYKVGRGCISYISYIKPQHLSVCTTTKPSCISYISYIKPQRSRVIGSTKQSCISYISYIKPQQTMCEHPRTIVVSLIYPTSNHNRGTTINDRSEVVSLIYPTSNHNPLYLPLGLPQVVSLIYPTSNHNLCLTILKIYLLYLLYILHQTTTTYKS